MRWKNASGYGVLPMVFGCPCVGVVNNDTIFLWSPFDAPSRLSRQACQCWLLRYTGGHNDRQRVIRTDSNDVSETMPPKLAIFDLDNTLIRGDSDHAWGEFLLSKGAVDAAVYARNNDYFYQQYRAGQLDVKAYLAFALEPFTRYSLEQLERWRREFMDTAIAPLHLPKAETLLEKHRERGDHLLIITATHRFIAGPIAASLGVQDLLATELAVENGRYTGAVVGEPCFQQGKVHHLQRWLEQHPYTLEGSFFYSDSHNDLPLLEHVAHPHVVDADERLTQVAQQRGWPQLSLR